MKTIESHEKTKRKNERRRASIDYGRRKFNRREKEFLFKKTVYLNDTNMMGNTYFARYFDWQGSTREDFFKFLMPNYEAFLQAGIKLITLEAQMKYLYESVLYDDILIKLRLGTITPASVELFFSFLNQRSGKVLAKGSQKIAFADKTGKFMLVPQEIREAAKKAIHGLEV